MGLFDYRYRVRKKRGSKMGAALRLLRKYRLYVLLGATALAVALITLWPKGEKPSPSPEQPGSLELPQTHGQSASPSPTNAPPSPSPEVTAQPTPEPELKVGMESEGVRALQQKLMELGYIDIDEPTAYFGSATNFALQLFQRQHGLQVDGIFGGKTREILFSDAARPYTLFEGALGLDVEMLQQRLKQLGFIDKVTGYYGTETIKAVTAFQKRNRLKEDGKTGEMTLELVYSSKAKGPKGVSATTRGNTKGLEGAIAQAKKLLGKRYVWGAQGPNTFDCSGFVYYLLKNNGVKTGRLNAAGFSRVDAWTKVSKMSELRAGDLLFFSTNGKRIGHTGIYIGDGMMIDASSSNGKVVRRSCTTAFWKRNFVNGRRPW